MSFWIIILIVIAVVCVSGAIYMTTAIGRFGAIRRISGDKKWLRRLISFGILLCGMVIFGFVFDIVNAVIIFLHEIIFFLIFGGIFKLIQKVRKKPFRTYAAGWFAIGVSLIYLSVGYVLCNHVWMTTYDLTTDKSIAPVRVAVLSDSHIGSTFSGEEFKDYLDEIMKQNPDLVLLPGDFVDDGTDREDMISACRSLGSIHPKYGVWFAYGNHDKGYYSAERRGYSPKDLENELERNGVRVLEDELMPIGKDILLVGRADKSSRNGRAELSDLLFGVDTSRYIIVMDHQPNDYEKESATDADLVVSGHTHGGQLLPFNEIGVWLGINDRTYGYEKRGHTDFIVSSGISDWEMRFKTGTKSEYVILQIQKPA